LYNNVEAVFLLANHFSDLNASHAIEVRARRDVNQLALALAEQHCPVLLNLAVACYWPADYHTQWGVRGWPIRLGGSTGQDKEGKRKSCY
jgi:hypothetical protein